MDKKLPFSSYLVIGVMLFALFFGAGNLIFPAELGQNAGSNVWLAILGFLLTGVGLPLLGILAMGYSGSRNLQELASRIHPVYAVIFTSLLYLTIGPFLRHLVQGQLLSILQLHRLSVKVMYKLHHSFLHSSFSGLHFGFH